MVTDRARSGPRRHVPDLELVRSWPLLLDQPAPATHEDANGHVGVVGHMALYDEAAWPWMALLGLDPTAGGATLMDLQHHVQYLAEIMVGDDLSVHGSILARDVRRLHGYWAILNRTRDRVAGTLEFLSLHVDLGTRRSADFQPGTGAVIDAQVSVAPDAAELACCLTLAPGPVDGDRDGP